MRTIYRYFILFATVVLVAGCIQEDLPEVETSVEIAARMECEADTKTSLSGLENGMYYPLWSAGDEIAVFADDDKNPSKFNLISGEESTAAMFSGTRKGKDYFALYPYDVAGSISDGVLSVNLPETQKYVKGSFGPGAFPMVASGSASEGLRFMNLCSVLKISFTGTAAVKSVTLTANDENTFLSGSASVVVENADTDKALLVMSAGASRSVVLETKGLEISEDSPADVFIVIPSQTYKGGLTIEVDTYTEKITKKISTALTFERSQIRAIKDFELDSEVPDIIPETIPDNEIWYKSDYGKDAYLRSLDPIAFDANIVEHVYEGGKWIIRFDKELKSIESPSLRSMPPMTRITELYLPNTLENLGDMPPLEIKEFYVPKNLKSINMSGVSFGNKLEKFYGDNVSEDGRCIVINNKLVAFAPAGLEEYTIPKDITTIGRQSFSSNELKALTIPEGVTTVECEACFNCPMIEYINLPSSLTHIGVYAFLSSKLKKINGNSKFVSNDGYSIVIDNYSKGKTFIVNYASGASVTSYEIPEGVEGIASYCFYHAENLRELTFPSTLTDIASSHSFEGTYNIERIYGSNVLSDNRSFVIDSKLLYVADKGITEYNVPECVSVLGAGIFEFKQHLKEVHMSDNITHVEYPGHLFQESPNLKIVTISARMQNFEYDPFSTYQTANNFESVYLRAPIPPVIRHNAPEYIPNLFSNLTIYVPEESLEAYMSSPDWAPYRGYFKGYNYTDLPENDTYVSSDYSEDGVVTKLQTATVGNGIDIVLMGDAYSDREIADGTYRTDMENLYNNLFTEEPYKSFKDYFNVHYVNVVSATEGYEYGNTALDTYFGDGTLVGGSDNACFKYALNAISENEMDEALIIVVMNSDNYAGTCYMYYPESATGTYGSGPALAYFPKGGDAETFAQVLHHEANGHGFAKLADEYAYEDMGAVPSDYVTEIKDQQNNWGWWKNVDFTSDPEQVRWSYFLDDTRYQYESLGTFEGGLTYWSGVWRPTVNSIMNDNTGDFNAPSREAIYYRIHKLAYGDSWEYDYEDFVAHDAVNRAASASAPQKARRNYVERPFEPTVPPVVVGKSWR